MTKSFLISAATCAALLTGAQGAIAAANPPASTTTQQWWTHPLGCQYSRAGRPGETMWFLIVNTARKGCPTYITGTSWGGVYKKHGRKM